MSTDAGVAYVVERVATLWDLAADGAVAIRWANGHQAVTNRPRGADPELCPSCDAASKGWQATATTARRHPVFGPEDVDPSVNRRELRLLSTSLTRK
jgi:hypothetical protein